MKVLITGAHFTPAQAVINELKSYPETEIVYLGRKYTLEGDKSISVESQEIPKLGVKFIPIVTGRLQRNFSIYTLISLLKLPVGFIQSFYYLVKERPDVILSFGGYTAVPVVVSAWLLSIPIIIHEQTLVMGLANSISKIFADKIAVSFEKNKGKKTVVTGNPIRQELLIDINPDKRIEEFIASAKKEKMPILFITGGNQGSHIINKTVLEVLGDLTKKYYVIHQTGDSKFKDFDSAEQLAQELGLKNYLVSKWITVNNMRYIYQNCNVCISRAGINTLLELAYFKTPTLVIPIPYLYKNEQAVNANFFENLGLSKTLAQKDLDVKSIISKIEEVKTMKVSEDISNVVKLDAAKTLALETVTLAISNNV